MDFLIEDEDVRDLTDMTINLSECQVGILMYPSFTLNKIL